MEEDRKLVSAYININEADPASLFIIDHGEDQTACDDKAESSGQVTVSHSSSQLLQICANSPA